MSNGDAKGTSNVYAVAISVFQSSLLSNLSPFKMYAFVQFLVTRAKSKVAGELVAIDIDMYARNR